jgi:hypothetical protein
LDTNVDPDLLREAERFVLRFECEHCAHFVEESGGCAEGFPNEVHRAVRLASAARIVFCKRFELV